jgi:hypothetical protein
MWNQIRKKARQYASVECGVEADKNIEEACRQISLSPKAVEVVRYDLIESTPFRRSLGSAMAGGFTSYSIAALQRCSILRFGLVFQIHPH